MMLASGVVVAEDGHGSHEPVEGDAERTGADRWCINDENMHAPPHSC